MEVRRIPNWDRTTSNTELYHHGIKGQKWGVENGPPYPLGSDVSTGHKLKESSNNKKKSQNNVGELSSYSAKKETSKKKFTVDKNTIKKALLITGGIAIGAAAVYVAKNHLAEEYFGLTVKNTTILNTVTSDLDKTMNLNNFYAAFKNVDKKLYEGMYADQLRKRDNGLLGALLGRHGAAENTVYNISTKLARDLKVPSRKEAAKTFKELYDNDRDFSKSVDTIFNLGKSNIVQRMSGAGVLSLKDIQDPKKAYDIFNIMIAWNPDTKYGFDKAKQKYFNELSRKGFDAIVDRNDRKYSGYGAKMPLIVFNKNAIGQRVAKELSNESINRQFNKVKAREYVKAMAPAALEIGLGLMGAAAAYKNKKDKEHYEKAHLN